MKKSDKEPVFKFSEQEVADKSNLAKAFFLRRQNQNQALLDSQDPFVKRFINLDHNCYLNGHLNCVTKELIGLAASAVLRCDDCIYYHVLQAYRLGAGRGDIEETMSVAMMVGGSIVIPHARRAYELISELFT